MYQFQFLRSWIILICLKSKLNTVYSRFGIFVITKYCLISTVDIEVHIFLQVAEGLSFLHNDVKLLHRNLCPHNILINKEGAWKIFGFDYSVHCISGAEAIVNNGSLNIF